MKKFKINAIRTDEYINKEIVRMLGNIRGTVLDIGCGTGLLVELIYIPSTNYIGIDPSVLILAPIKNALIGSGEVMDRVRNIV